MMALQIHRCVQCGKWSHAKKRPKKHQRIIVDKGQGVPTGVVVIHYTPGSYDHLNGYGDPGGWTVECGPFQTFDVISRDDD